MTACLDESLLEMSWMKWFVQFVLSFALMLSPLAAGQSSAFSATSAVPGVVIAHYPAKSGKYIGSAGLACCSNGDYLAKCDEFGPTSTENTSAVTRVYCSKDRGKSWRQIVKIDGLFWSNIFEFRGAVYMIGTHHQHGALVVYKSIDSGKTWSTPKDGKSGLIREGKFHTAPVPIVIDHGRLWRAFEDADGPSGWGQMYRPHVMSISVDGNLLDANQWTITNPIKRDGGWLGGTFWCVLEGNIVVDRNGVVRNILRSNHDDTAAVATVSADGKTEMIDPAFDRTSLSGSSKKFVIRWDKASQLYWALSNPPPPNHATEAATEMRNTLAMFSSPDLRHWTMKCILLYHPDAKFHAFQYPDWLVEGDELLVVSRTAYDDGQGGAHSSHDANFLTFHRFPNFRYLTMADGVQVK